MTLKEGNVVVVTGKLDDNVRQQSNKDQLAFGTVIWIAGNTMAVILTSGDIWYGPPYQAQLASLQKQG